MKLYKCLLLSLSSLSLFITPHFLVPLAEAQVTMMSFKGDLNYEQRGPVALAGDVDGDTVPDIIVGSPGYNLGAPVYQIGRAEVFSGSDGRLLRTINGTQSGAWYGGAVSGAGDVNRDGVADFMVGGYSYTPAINAYKGGIVRVFSGSDGSQLYEFSGATDFRNLGSAIAGGADFDLDGFPDFVIGAKGDDPVTGPFAGGVFVYSGRTGAVMFSSSGAAYAQLGTSVAILGDVNLDGYPDYAAGASYDSLSSAGSSEGSVHVFSGRNGGLLFTLWGTQLGELLGTSVAGVGDVNSDGYPDIVAGGVCNSQIGQCSGVARVFSGLTGLELYALYGDNGFDLFGQSVAGMGDYNLDGVPDFAVGAPQDVLHAISGSGYVRVFSGSTGNVLSTLTGPPNDISTPFGNGLGRYVAALGDLNGDLYPELGAGLPLLSTNGKIRNGMVRVFSAANSAVIGAACGTNGGPTVVASTATIGQPLIFTGTAQPNSSGALFLSFIPDVSQDLGAGCRSYLDLASAIYLGPVTSDASGNWGHAILIPNQANLVGSQIAAQALFFNGTPFEVTNGTRIRVQ